MSVYWSCKSAYFLFRLEFSSVLHWRRAFIPLIFSFSSRFSCASLSTYFCIFSNSFCFLSLHLRALFLFWSKRLSLFVRSGYYILFSILNSWLLVEASSSERFSKSQEYSFSLERFLSEKLSTSSPLLPNSWSPFEFTDSCLEERRLLPESLSLLTGFLTLWGFYKGFWVSWESCMRKS